MNVCLCLTFHSGAVEPQIKEQLKAAKDQDLGEVVRVGHLNGVDSTCVSKRCQLPCPWVIGSMSAGRGGGCHPGDGGGGCHP